MAEIKPGYFILVPLAFIGGMLLFIISPHTQVLVITPSVTPTPVAPTPTPTPTPKPLSFADLNRIYGPCIRLPVLMYHHIQDLTVAQAGKYLSLTVSPAIFSSQLQYLSDRSYHPVSTSQLAAFFKSGTPLPPKPVLLTFDDGYADFYQNALPVLKKFGYPGLLFLPTGLADNPGYVSWAQVRELSGSGLVTVGNHTWSHQSMKSDAATDLREISTADTQLNERGLNLPKTFAYPYGTIGKFAQTDLQNLNYSLAFTTSPGTVQCFKNRLHLPRIRIGNSSLNNYGF